MEIFIRKAFKKNRGFTLIELMIVVMVLTILTSFAFPAFMKYRSKSMQSEATILLKGLWTSEIAHYGEKSEFTMEDAVLNFDPLKHPKFYKNWYIRSYDDDKHFIATCSTNLDSDAFLDVWRITDTSGRPKYDWDDVKDIGPEP